MSAFAPVMLVLSFAATLVGCDATPPPPEVSVARQALTGGTNCSLATRVPGTDPNKPDQTVCRGGHSVPSTATAAYLAKQQDYLAKWKAEAAKLVGLPEAEVKARRHEFKRRILEGP